MVDPARARFSRDVWWNVAGLGVAGIAGIVLNYLISVVYGAGALGVFNQVFAVYLLVSQFAALGFHYSVLTHVAAADTPDERRAITTSAMLVTLLVATGFALAFWLSSDLVGDLLDSEAVATGMVHASPGVLCFALNKVALSCLNGLRRMRTYAVLFAGRFVVMISAFVACAAADLDHAALPIILSISEAVILLAAVPAICRQLGLVPRSVLRRWIGAHLRFGGKGFLGGMFAELNTRVDVLMLGYFASDAVVGAYSFAAILAEGLFQLLIVLRSNYAPIVIRLWSEGRTADLVATVRRARDRIYLGALAVGAIAVVGYLLLVPRLTSDPALVDSGAYFAVLIAGMVASAGYAPFQPLPLYAGFPGWQVVLMIAIVALNAIGNVILIAAIGAIGAAIATAIAFVAGVVLLRILVARRLDLRI